MSNKLWPKYEIPNCKVLIFVWNLFSPQVPRNCTKLNHREYWILNCKKAGLNNAWELLLLWTCVLSAKHVKKNKTSKINRGSYMSAHVILNLLNQLGKRIRCEALLSILSVLPKEFNKFNNTGAWMQGSIYHMTIKLHFVSDFCIKTSRFPHLKTSMRNVTK